MTYHCIIPMDCRQAMDIVMSPKSIHTVVTSPPYFGLRDYGVDGQIGLETTPDEFVAALVEVFRSVRRVLRDDGTVWLNLGDSYAANRAYQVPSTKGGPKHGPAQGVNGAGSTIPDGLKAKDLIGIPWRVAFALQADGWYLRQDIIWHKPNPMPESVKDRCTRSHEYIFLLSKSPNYYFDSDAIKEPAVNTRKPGRKITDTRETHGTGGGNSGINNLMARYHNGEMPTHRNKRSVWTVTTKPFKGAHFATFPIDLIEPCILAGCPVGGTVYDPFGGSGTTALAALKHGRNVILSELNPDYAAMAHARITGDA